MEGRLRCLDWQTPVCSGFCCWKSTLELSSAPKIFVQLPWLEQTEQLCQLHKGGKQVLRCAPGGLILETSSSCAVITALMSQTPPRTSSPVVRTPPCTGAACLQRCLSPGFPAPQCSLCSHPKSVFFPKPWFGGDVVLPSEGWLRARGFLLLGSVNNGLLSLFLPCSPFGFAAGA